MSKVSGSKFYPGILTKGVPALGRTYVSVVKGRHTLDTTDYPIGGRCTQLRLDLSPRPCGRLGRETLRIRPLANSRPQVPVGPLVLRWNRDVFYLF